MSKFDRKLNTVLLPSMFHRCLEFLLITSRSIHSISFGILPVNSSRCMTILSLHACWRGCGVIDLIATTLSLLLIQNHSLMSKLRVLLPAFVSHERKIGGIIFVVLVQHITGCQKFSPSIPDINPVNATREILRGNNQSNCW